MAGLQLAWEAAGGGGAPLTAAELQEMEAGLEALRETAVAGWQLGPPPLDQLLPLALEHLRGGVLRLACRRSGAHWAVRGHRPGRRLEWRDPGAFAGGGQPVGRAAGVDFAVVCTRQEWAH